MIRKVVVVFLVVAMLFLTEVLAYADIAFTLAPVFVAVVYATYMAGLRVGLASAGVVSAYELWKLWGIDEPRAILVSLSVVGVAVMVGLLKRKARIVDTLNGNIARLRRAIDECDTLLDSWYVMREPERLERLRRVRGNLSDLATLVIGWHTLAKEKAGLDREEGSN